MNGRDRISWSADEIRRISHRVADQVADHLISVPDGPVYRRPPRELIETMRATPWAEQGATADDVLDQFAAQIEPYPFGNGHPRFAAWVNSPPNPLGVFASALAAAMDPSVAGGEHASVHLEHQVLRWFAELLGWPSGYSGQLVSGGSAATLTALAAARHRAAAGAGLDDRRDGTPDRFAVYAGAEAHSCITKAVEVLGIGSANIRVVDSDGTRRICPDHLDALISADLVDGRIPVVAVASVGTVNTGAIDPLSEIADVCAHHGVWMHVDAAYGGPAVLLLERYRDVLAGLSRADSLAVDPHKWLYVPVDAGLVLVRDGSVARDTFSLVPPYLRTEGDAPWFTEFGLEQTRPFRALKVSMQLRHLGRRGYRELIERDLAVAEQLRDAVAAAPDLELLGSGMSIVCFRHRPGGMASDELDEHNRAVLNAVQLGGRSFLAGTVVDGVFALRACIVNPLTSSADALAIIDDVRARGAVA
ncbi:MAG: aminotransferase class V-fold PLP-dependent enzyme [Actinomycetota bacterium]|nr:aminotransferase class V-fold PLP-dependent enzyme [Actinomycetota bacterium]